MTQTPGSSAARANPTVQEKQTSVHAALRWVYVLGCMFVVGPVVLRVVARVHDAHGGHAATLLTDGAAGLVALLVVLVACVIVGALGARAFTLGVGAMGAGIVAAWGAWGCATIDTIVRATSSSSVMKPLAVEGLICGVAGAAMVHLFEMIAKRAQPAGTDDPMAIHASGGAGGGGAKKARVMLGGVVVMDRSASMAAVLAAGLVGACAAAGLATWMVAVTVMKGQVVAGAIAAGIAAGMASVYAAQSAKGAVRGVVPAMGVALIAGAGPIVALILNDKDLVPMAMQGTLHALARPIGLDWLAGILCGVPLGMSWAGLKLDARATPQGNGFEPTNAGSPASKGV